MKAHDFLMLVSSMMKAQQDYFKARRSDQLNSHNFLIKAKELEKQVMVVIDEGRLEPDDYVPIRIEPKQGNLFNKEDDNDTH